MKKAALLSEDEYQEFGFHEISMGNLLLWKWEYHEMMWGPLNRAKKEAETAFKANKDPQKHDALREALRKARGDELRNSRAMPYRMGNKIWPSQI